MSHELKSSVKDRLRIALAEANMRPIDLSEQTGIPKSMISYYLNGKTKPKSDRIYSISKVLGVSEAWLLGYDVPKNRTVEQKKNDDLVSVIAKLRKDPEFFEVVSMLAGLPADQYESIKGILTALGKK
jgi:transcriptional regulator with XRE-family HTH domain